MRVYEAESTVGGSLRSGELLRPGVIHDFCSTIQSLALVSPFLKSLALADYGIRFAHPKVPFAHPLDDGSAVVAERSVEETAKSLGSDGSAYRAFFAPLVSSSDDLMEAVLHPIGFSHPLLLARFGVNAIRSAAGFAKGKFRSERTRAFFAGVAAHSLLPLCNFASAGFAMALIEH